MVTLILSVLCIHIQHGQSYSITNLFWTLFWLKPRCSELRYLHRMLWHHLGRRCSTRLRWIIYQNGRRKMAAMMEVSKMLKTTLIWCYFYRRMNWSSGQTCSHGKFGVWTRQCCQSSNMHGFISSWLNSDGHTRVSSGAPSLILFCYLYYMIWVLNKVNWIELKIELIKTMSKESNLDDQAYLW